MDDDALYHNLATIGSTAGDIEAQIKAFQSMSAVQGSSFNSDDTLFVIGSGEEAVVSSLRASAATPEMSADSRNHSTGPPPRRPQSLGR